MAVGQQDAQNDVRPTLVARMFSEHPRSLGMTWASHGAGAVVIGARLIAAGAACLVHALVPGLFSQTAGRTVTSMHDEIVRRKAGAANPNAWPDYEI